MAVISAAIGTISMAEALTMLSSSATLAFLGGGAGDGDGAGVTRTVTTRTITATAMAMTATALAMTATALATDMILIGPVRSTALQANQGSLSCSGDSPVLAIITVLSTGSWGPRRGAQFKLTSATMDMRADRSPIFSPMGMR